MGSPRPKAWTQTKLKIKKILKPAKEVGIEEWKKLPEVTAHTHQDMRTHKPGHRVGIAVQALRSGPTLVSSAEICMYLTLTIILDRVTLSKSTGLPSDWRRDWEQPQTAFAQLQAPLHESLQW